MLLGRHCSMSLVMQVCLAAWGHLPCTVRDTSLHVPTKLPPQSSPLLHLVCSCASCHAKPYLTKLTRSCQLLLCPAPSDMGSVDAYNVCLQCYDPCRNTKDHLPSHAMTAVIPCPEITAPALAKFREADSCTKYEQSLGSATHTCSACIFLQ